MVFVLLYKYFSFLLFALFHLIVSIIKATFSYSFHFLPSLQWLQVLTGPSIINKRSPSHVIHLHELQSLYRQQSSVELKYTMLYAKNRIFAVNGENERVSAPASVCRTILVRCGLRET
jgi:hypothetical protein